MVIAFPFFRNRLKEIEARKQRLFKSIEGIGDIGVHEASQWHRAGWKASQALEGLARKAKRQKDKDILKVVVTQIKRMEQSAKDSNNDELAKSIGKFLKDENLEDA